MDFFEVFDPELLQYAPLSIYSCFASSIWKKFTDRYTFPTTIGFDTSLVLCLIQTVIAFLLVGFFRVSGVISYTHLSKREVPKWIWVSFLFVMKTYTSDVAAQYLSSAVYSIFEKSTIVIVALGELHLFARRITKLLIGAFALMIASPLILHYQEMFRPITGFQGVYGSNPIGLSWMTISSMSTIGLFLLLRRRIVATNFGDFDTVFYFTMITVPFLLGGSFVFDKWFSGGSFETGFVDGEEFHGMFSILLSGITWLWALYGSVWCIRTTSATTYLVVMALSALPRMVIETAFTQGEYLDAWSISSSGVLVVSGVIFVWAQIRQGDQNEMEDYESVNEIIEAKV